MTEQEAELLSRAVADELWCDILRDEGYDDARDLARTIRQVLRSQGGKGDG